MNTGLFLFIVSVVLNVLGLLLDWFLWSMGWQTITDRVRTDWIVAVPIIEIQLIGLFGLIIHFFKEIS